MRLSHIPGPWRADDHQMVWGKTKRGEIMICQIRGWGHLTGPGGLHLPDEQAAAIQDANLRLCAAAPDLLDALKTMVASAHPHPVEHPTMTAAWEKARAVIAKAEGRL